MNRFPGMCLSLMAAWLIASTAGAQISSAAGAQIYRVQATVSDQESSVPDTLGDPWQGAPSRLAALDSHSVSQGERAAGEDAPLNTTSQIAVSSLVWGRWEAAFDADQSVEDAQSLTWDVQFTAPDGDTRTVPGFWDGGRQWKVRFMPDQPGKWHFRTQAQPPLAGLHDRQGGFVAKESVDRGNPFLRHGPLRVAENGRYLEHQDGTPFFWLLDTAWNGALKSTEDGWRTYLHHRVAQKFTGIQFVTTQWRAAHSDRRGQTAYSGRENITIHPEFFQRLDQRVDAVNDSGLLAAPVLLWALGNEDEVPGKLPEDQAILLARYITARYGAHHVVWFLAGDENFSGDRGARWERIGRGVFGQHKRGLVTLHPQGRQWHFDPFLDEDWFDLIIYQSSHGGGPQTLAWLHSGAPFQKWQAAPPRPIINSEPGYEDHVAWERHEPHTAFDIRQQSYYSLLASPTAGVSYGAHGVWSWEDQPAEPLQHKGSGIAQPWHKAMNLPGSEDLKHLATLFTYLDWWTLRPDPALLAEHPGSGDPTRHVAAARSEDGALAVVYLPHGSAVQLRSDRIKPGSQAMWFNPRDGSSSPAEPGTEGRYTAPDSHDWVLVLRSEAQATE